MKSQFAPLYLVFLLAFFLVSNSASPPDGRTGAPDDGACINCHTGNNPNNFEGTLDIEGLPDELMPNTLYQLTVKATKTSGNPVRAGFQMVALDASDSNTGNFANPGPSSSLKTNEGRTYFGHRPALRFEDQDEVSWTVDWTSPAVGGTAITFYANSIFGNGNSSDGDFNLPIVITKPIIAVAQSISIGVSSKDVSCFGENDGSLTLEVGGGTGNISYSWSNGSQEESIDNLPAGTYSVTISDEAGSETSTTFLVTEPSPLELSLVEQTNIDCNNSLGSATVEATGGAANYTYRWVNGEGATIELEDGVHIVTVTDGNGCTQTASVTIDKNILLPQVNAGPSRMINCTGPVVDLEGNASQGEEFAYLWTTQAGSILAGERTLMPTIEARGIYTLLVTNTTTGCSASSQVEVIENRIAPIANAGTNKELSCAENATRLDGSNSSIGTNFEYTWTTNDGAIISDGNTLTPSVGQAGTYTLRVVDNDNGCFSSAMVSVIQDVNMPSAFAGEAQTLDCNTTQLALNGNGSAGVDFIYSWETEDGQITSGENTLSPVISAPGTYRLTVRNRTNGCDASSSVTITGMAAITAVIDGDAELSCNDSPVATLNSNNSSSGENVVYTWTTEDGNIISETSATAISVDMPGTYTLTVRDDTTGCQDEAQIIVISTAAAPALTVMENEEIDCDNPTIALQATTTSEVENLSIQWLSEDGNILMGATTLNPIINEPGTYNIGVFDATTGCATTASIVVTESTDAISVVIEETTTDGEPIATAAGGTPPYSFEWQIMPMDEDATVMNVSGDKYVVTVTDANGCSTVATAVVATITSIPTIASLTSIEVFPNPAQSGLQLNATFNRMEEGAIRLFNSLGEQVWQQTFTTNTIQTKIETTQWEGGVYYLMLQTAEGVKVEEVIIL